MCNLLVVSIALTFGALAAAWMVQQIPGPDKKKPKPIKRYIVEEMEI